MSPEITLLIELLLIALIVALLAEWARRPYTIALVIWGLVLGLLQLVEPMHLSKELVLTVFLPPLLFEGALHIGADLLRRRAGLVFGLALIGTPITVAIVGLAAHVLLGIDLLVGLLLGTMIAPTDPVSVLATFREARVDPELATVVEGESLFNDGVAVVLYVMLLSVLGGGVLQPAQTLGQVALVVGAAAALGVGVGALASQALARLDDHVLEITLTLIVVYGTYLLAEHLHLSGVIAVAVAGLVIGNYGMHRTTSRSQEGIVLFWEAIAFLVNSVVFLLIGFELHPDRLTGSAVSILIVMAVLLAVRALIVYSMGAAIDRWQQNLPMRWRHVILWGGLRGAVPVALALGLPRGLADRDLLVSIVFGVVLLSLLGQGLTMPWLLRRLGVAQSESAREVMQVAEEAS